MIHAFHTSSHSPQESATYPDDIWPDDKPFEAVVCYRKPHAQTFTRLLQYTTPQTVKSLHNLPLSGGYVICPFVADDAHPLIFIEPDITEHFSVLPPTNGNGYAQVIGENEERNNYTRSFASAHQRLTQGELQKIVLSRRLHIQQQPSVHHSTTENTPLRIAQQGLQYFLRACQSRPECFVAFWWTRATNAWMVATPEPLLIKKDELFGTVALAGTQPWSEKNAAQWDDKNQEEQAIVARFIAKQLRETACNIQQSETFSLHTGNIQHLCTIFDFNLPEPESLRNLLIRLHPTPAVCGLPRDAALRAIAHDEPTSRNYYAGFNGPIQLEGDTSLYVSLRCMQFDMQQATLYAGGGLMPESIENDEWEETQRKLQTMLQLF